jgi:RNA polymerase sigma-54 factor
LVIGNLNEDGYLIASDDEMMGVIPPAAPEVDSAVVDKVVQEAAALGLNAEIPSSDEMPLPEDVSSSEAVEPEWNGSGAELADDLIPAALVSPEPPVETPKPVAAPVSAPPVFVPNFNITELHEAIELVRQLDPPGVGCRDLRECLLYQLRFHQQQLESQKNGNGEREATVKAIGYAVAIVDQHLRAVQNKQHKEIARALGCPPEAVDQALTYIRTLDPRPGLRYNKVQPRLIEPDVAFVKHGDEWLVIMNDEDVPQLRLNPAYKRLLVKDGNDKDTRNYVKERYKSAIQLIKNIEQRKQTIMKVCYSIVARQQDFLEKGIDELKPMMIKEVAEEIGVHPSTVSRAVASKYAHTQQGVFELRYFFSESVNGPEGGNTSLLILKRRVKKLIEEEDPARPLTDEQITRILQSQGIQVTRRTVAKYREDMRIPSTHQRRVKK